MGRVFTNRQREAMYRIRGRPTLTLEFDVFPPDQVSMWAHTRHEIPFAEMKAAFEAIEQHIHSFLLDGDMCPFHPDFVRETQKDGNKEDVETKPMQPASAEPQSAPPRDAGS